MIQQKTSYLRFYKIFIFRGNSIPSSIQNLRFHLSLDYLII